MNLAAWRTRRNRRMPSIVPIALAESSSQLDRAGGVTTLHFRWDASGPARLEALRDARRAMIREEWTLGLETGEPSLTEAEFTANGVHWQIPIGDQASCRQKLRILVARANRQLEGVAGSVF